MRAVMSEEARIARRKEKQRGYSRKYQRKWRRLHRAEKRVQDRAYLERNREAVYARNRARYHRLTPAEKLERSLRVVCQQRGITVEKYREMEKRQKGRCAICRGLPCAGEIRLDIDHDHKSGEARKLLCRRCNLALGHLESGGGLKFVRQLVRYMRSIS